MPSPSYDAIILGAGAAGLMCAAVAGQRGRRILLVEHGDAVGRKIVISGGGRCNFTNMHVAPDRYLSANPHFAKSALRRYTAADFVALVERYGIGWHEKTLGQLFCDGSARQIVDMLVEECAIGRVEIALASPFSDIGHDGSSFTLALPSRTVTARQLVIATGGPSIPKLGATAVAYDLARRFGLKVVEPRPALVPLTLGGDEALFRTLSGVAADVVAIAGKTRFREAALFTHRGLSGPAILQISSYWRPREPIEIDFVPDAPADWLKAAKRSHPRATVKRMLSTMIPERLGEALVDRLDLPSELGNIPDRRLDDAARALSQWRFMPNGSEGFAKAEVTVGGISTADLSSQTLEARRVPGLYAIGEAVDVTGWLGGYNFQWAWASGWAAAQAL